MNIKNWFKGFVVWLIAVTLGCGIVSAWWLPGVTQLETPGLPYLLPERAYISSSDLTWFDPTIRFISFEFLYFSIMIIILSLLSFLMIIINKRIPYRWYYIPSFISFCFTLAISFKQVTYLGKYVPFISSLVLGRVLTISAFIGSVLVSILVYWLLLRGSKKITLYIFSIIIGVSFLYIIYLDFSPYFEAARTKSIC